MHAHDDQMQWYGSFIMSKSSSKPYFSKSKLISAHLCAKKAYLEKYHKDRAETSSDTEAAFKIGNDVGDIAKELYGTPAAVEIEYRFPMSEMIQETTALIAQGFRGPIFEATFQHEGILIRADVLLPDGDGWRAIEVKASTRVKDEHQIDCAIQLWVMRGVGLQVNSIALAHINNEFVYQGDGDYSGLLVEEDITELATAMKPDVLALIKKATKAVSGDMPEVPVGLYCEDPYACAFAGVCWPRDTDYPIRNIGGSRPRIFEWVSRGFCDVRDVPAEEITAARQQRIYRVTCAGEPEILPGAKEELEALEYPRYHLDFETANPGIPIFEGSRPYQTHAVQWSIHMDDGKGDGSLASMQHYEFLDLSGDPPMRPLAEKMIECLGDSGPVFMYTSYEKGVINELIRLFPDLEPQLQAIIERLYDLAKVVERYYYHPDMMGSFSIKKVVPAMVPSMNYADLEGINEGNGAAMGFVEAVHPDTTPERKAELEKQLLRYCRFDTEAMVEITRYLCTGE